MTSPLRAAAALLIVLSLLLLGGPAVADDAELDDHGWWWRAQGGATELPPPPFVPEDGLSVARDVDGTMAVSAVRYLVAEDGESADLTLQTASEQGGEVAEIRACPADGDWSGAEAGDWDARPEPDCDAGEVIGVRDEDEETWTFDLDLLLADGRVDVVLVPAAADEAEDDEPAPGLPASPGAEQGAPFQVSFEPPEDGSLEAGGGIDDFEFEGGEDFDDPEVADGGPDEGSDPGAQPDLGPQDAGPAPVGSPDDAPLPEGGGGGLTEDEPTADEPEVADPADDEDVSLVAPGEEDPAEEQAAATESVGVADTRGRQAALALALLAVAAAFVLWRDPARPASAGVRGLRGSMIVHPDVATRWLHTELRGGEVAGGLGRFARPREGSPPPL